MHDMAGGTGAVVGLPSGFLQQQAMQGVVEGLVSVCTHLQISQGSPHLATTWGEITPPCRCPPCRVMLLVEAIDASLNPPPPPILFTVPLGKEERKVRGQHWR